MMAACTDRDTARRILQMRAASLGGLRWSAGWRLAFLAAHAPLALAMKSAHAAAGLHAVSALAAGLWCAATGKPAGVAFALSYIAGAEVLWRMTGAPLVWEYGKYATALVAMAAIARIRPKDLPLAPVLYFVLLVPSAFLTLAEQGPAVARETISFNLSGPFSLAVCLVFFGCVRLTAEQLAASFLFFLAPTVGIAALALRGISAAQALHFTGESSFKTSGGFGPNQVSAILGLAALLSLLCFLWGGGAFRFVFVGLTLWLAAQSAMTFSRGGLYAAAGALAVAAPMLVRDRRSLAGILIAAPLVAGLGWFVVVPALDSFTGGKLAARFEDRGMTHREELIGEDIRIWYDHPVAGVGPGMARYHRESLGATASHTEFTRLLSEHGMLGMFALAMLLFEVGRRFLGAREREGKALVLAAGAWSTLFMCTSGMRLAAPSVLMGLTAAGIVKGRKRMLVRIRAGIAHPGSEVPRR